MKARLALFAAIIWVVTIASAWAEKPLKDYSFIRGVNYGMNGDQAVLERDLGYAKRAFAKVNVFLRERLNPCAKNGY